MRLFIKSNVWWLAILAIGFNAASAFGIDQGSTDVSDEVVLVSSSGNTGVGSEVCVPTCDAAHAPATVSARPAAAPATVASLPTHKASARNARLKGLKAKLSSLSIR